PHRLPELTIISQRKALRSGAIAPPPRGSSLPPGPPNIPRSLPRHLLDYFARSLFINSARVKWPCSMSRSASTHTIRSASSPDSDPPDGVGTGVTEAVDRGATRNDCGGCDPGGGGPDS